MVQALDQSPWVHGLQLSGWEWQSERHKCKRRKNGKERARGSIREAEAKFPGLQIGKNYLLINISGPQDHTRFESPSFDGLEEEEFLRTEPFALDFFMLCTATGRDPDL